MTTLTVTLASLTIKSSVLLCLGLIVAALPKLPAATRHLALLAAVLSILVLPMISLAVPSLDIRLFELDSPARAWRGSGLDTSGADSAATSWQLGASTDALATALLLGWIGGAMLLVVRAIRSWAALYAMLQRATPVVNFRWLALLDECCIKLSLARPRLVMSMETDVAFVCGWLMPVIVVPADANEWSEARRRDVLLHELSHIERHDVVTQFAAQIACALYFWNPLALLAERRLREEREYACDDRALAAGQEPDAYASTLVDLAEDIVGHSRPTAPAMAGTSQLEKRVLAVLDSSRNRDGISARKAIVIGLPSAALLLAIAALRAAEVDSGAEVAPAAVDARSVPTSGISDRGSPTSIPSPWTVVRDSSAPIGVWVGTASSSTGETEQEVAPNGNDAAESPAAADLRPVPPH